VVEVDPRFDLVRRGTAPVVEYLGAAENPVKVGWAYPGVDYGKSIVRDYLAQLLAVQVKDETQEKIAALEQRIAELIQDNAKLKAERDRLVLAMKKIAGIANEFGP
jgi:DNA-binding transcriptional MerR regulator